MIAYNVEPYVGEAVKSVLRQEVSFDYELVIGEDCSADGTRELLMSFQEQHPERIRLLLRDSNLGMNENFVATLEACRGKYIALLDGDDYWIEPHKLQNQVEILESEPDLSAVFHNTLVQYEDEDTETHPFHTPMPRRLHERAIPKERSSPRDLITGNFIQTGSVMFRTGPCWELRRWYKHFPTFDWPLHLLNCQCGGIRYVDETLGVYRVRREGIWSTNLAKYDRVEDIVRFIEAYEFLEDRFGEDFGPIIDERLASFIYRLAILHARDGRIHDAAAAALRSLTRLPIRQRFTKKYLRRQWHLVKILLKAAIRSFRFPRSADRVGASSDQNQFER